jgi:vancomycin resistance protein YoaR
MSFFISLTLISTWLDHLEREYFGVQEGVTLQDIAMDRMLEDEVRDEVQELAIRYQKVAVEPRIEKNGQVIEEQEGLLVLVDSSVSRVLAAAPGDKVELVTRSIPCQHRSDEIRQAKKLIGRYASVIQGSPERIKNIQVAASGIHNTLVWPGEQFSFNETTGPRTVERGYLPAPIIINGGFELGLGGGVCQVSSTLYNAALGAKLKVTERSAHSKSVHYVPEGKDATVDYGAIDLKFLNNREQAVIVRMYVGGGQVVAEIWGGER